MPRGINSEKYVGDGINWSIRNRILVDGQKLSAARLKAERSLQDVADAIGCNKGDVSKWEREVMAPSEERIYRMADYLKTAEFIRPNPNYKKDTRRKWTGARKKDSQGEKQEKEGLNEHINSEL